MADGVRLGIEAQMRSMFTECVPSQNVCALGAVTPPPQRVGSDVPVFVVADPDDTQLGDRGRPG